MERHGSEQVVVVLGTPDADSTEICAETVTHGDPTYAGPLTGVSLGLPVYHVVEDSLKAAVDAQVYESQIGVMEDALDKAAIAEVLDRVRAGG